MPFNTSLLVLAILLGSGFLGGFCVSKGSGHYLGVKPVHSARAAGGGRNLGEEGAAAIMAAGGGGGSSEHVKMAGGGGSGADAMDADGAEGGDAGAGAGTAGMEGAEGGPGTTRTFTADDAPPAGAGSADAASARAFAKGPSVSIATGPDALAVLAGNSLKRDAPGGVQRYTYFATRGWQADGDERGFTVRTWDRSSGRFCEPVARPGKAPKQSCMALEIRYTSAETEADGALLGVMRIGRDDWAFLVKGNAAHFPDRIPSLDSAVEPQAAAGPVAKVTASGKAAWTAMQGRTFALGTTAAEPRIVTFNRDGRLLMVDAHGEGALANEGVKITLGRWTFDKGLLCQGGADPAGPRSCARPDAYGPTLVRLVPKALAAAGASPLAAATAPQQLQLMAEQKNVLKETQD